jgi:hypothetical protein
MKYLFLGALALFVVLGCNFTSGGDENSDVEIDTNENAGEVNPPLASAESLTVTNSSSRTICALYVSLQETTEWGEERLGTEVLSTGDSFGVEVPDGQYRIRASDCDNNLIAEYDDFEVNGATTLQVEDRSVDSTIVAAGDPGSLTVINNSPIDVCYVYVSATDATTWGNDWLDENTILDEGESATVVVGAGLYDLQAADCDGQAIAEQYDIDFSSGYTWTIGQ